MPNARSSSSSQARRRRSNSIVRDAFVTSVACSVPPVSRHSRKLSIVPKAISPASARSRRPGDVVEQPADLRRREIRVDRPARCGCATVSAEPRRAPALAQRRRCAGPARRSRCAPAGRCARSHSTVVSRWLVMPIAAIGRPRAAAIASRQVATTPARSPPDRARPSPAADRSGAVRPAPCDGCRPQRRTGSRGCWSCPGRSPAGSRARSFFFGPPAFRAGILALNTPRRCGSIRRRASGRSPC